MLILFLSLFFLFLLKSKLFQTSMLKFLKSIKNKIVYNLSFFFFYNKFSFWFPVLMLFTSTSSYLPYNINKFLRMYDFEYSYDLVLIITLLFIFFWFILIEKMQSFVFKPKKFKQISCNKDSEIVEETANPFFYMTCFAIILTIIKNTVMLVVSVSIAKHEGHWDHWWLDGFFDFDYRYLHMIDLQIISCYWNNLLLWQPSSALFKVFISLSALIILSFLPQKARISIRPEFFFIYLFLFLSALLVVASNNLIMLFVSLETFSISIIALMLCFYTNNRNNLNAAFKYYIINSLASFLLILGMMFLYGITGSFDFNVIKLMVFELPEQPATWSLYFSLRSVFFFLITGITLKLGVFPFHLWMVDVYTRLNSFIFAIMISMSKLVFFYTFYLFIDFFSLTKDFQKILIIASILTMFLAAVLGLTQTLIRNFLVIVSIYNSGFILFSFVSSLNSNFCGYSLSWAYLFIDTVLFLLLVLLLNSAEICSNNNAYPKKLIFLFQLNKLKNWNHKLIVSIFLLALSGLPPFSIFFLKINILSTVSYGYLSNSVIFFILIFTSINAYNYLRPIKFLLFSDDNTMTDTRSNQTSPISDADMNLTFFQFFLIFIVMTFFITFFFSFDWLIPLIAWTEASDLSTFSSEAHLFLHPDPAFSALDQAYCLNCEE